MTDDIDNPALVNPPPLAALGRIARYMFADEAKHYAEAHDLDTREESLPHALAHPDGEHIFCAVAQLHAWLWPEDTKSSDPEPAA
jgi:hypothetical protein